MNKQPMAPNHQIDWTEINRDMLNYRKAHFGVEVTPASHPSEDGEIDLSVTHNGNH